MHKIYKIELKLFKKTSKTVKWNEHKQHPQITYTY